MRRLLRLFRVRRTVPARRMVGCGDWGEPGEVGLSIALKVMPVLAEKERLR